MSPDATESVGAGVDSGAIHILADVMAIYKKSVAIMRNEMPSSIFLLHLLVQESRLSSFIRIFEHIVEMGQNGTDNPLRARMTQEIERGVSEAMLRTQVEMADKKSWRLVGKIKTQTNMERMEFLIEILTQLNNHLSDLINPENLKDLNTSLIDQLWSCSFEGLQALSSAGLGSASLRRTFDRASTRLKVWRDDLPFDLPQIEMMLKSSEDLYEGIAKVFERLGCLLCKLFIFEVLGNQTLMGTGILIRTARKGGLDIPSGPSAHIGRVIERVQACFLRNGIDPLNIDELSEEDLKLLSVRNNEQKRGIDPQQTVKNYIHHLCHRLFKLARMVDRVYQRHALTQNRRLLNLDQRKAALLENSLNSANQRISLLETAQTRINQEHMSLLKQVINLEDHNTVSLLHQTMIDRIQDVFKDLSDAMVHISIDEENIDIRIKTPLSSSFMLTKPKSLSQLVNGNVEAAIKVHERVTHLSQELQGFLQTQPKKIPEIDLLFQRVNTELERLRVFQKSTASEIDEVSANCTPEMYEAFMFALEHMNQILGE